MKLSKLLLKGGQEHDKYFRFYNEVNQLPRYYGRGWGGKGKGPLCSCYRNKEVKRREKSQEKLMVYSLPFTGVAPIADPAFCPRSVQTLPQKAFSEPSIGLYFL